MKYKEWRALFMCKIGLYEEDINKEWEKDMRELYNKARENETI